MWEISESEKGKRFGQCEHNINKHVLSFRLIRFSLTFRSFVLTAPIPLCWLQLFAALSFTSIFLPLHVNYGSPGPLSSSLGLCLLLLSNDGSYCLIIISCTGIHFNILLLLFYKIPSSNALSSPKMVDYSFKSLQLQSKFYLAQVTNGAKTCCLLLIGSWIPRTSLVRWKRNWHNCNCVASKFLLQNGKKFQNKLKPYCSRMFCNIEKFYRQTWVKLC